MTARTHDVAALTALLIIGLAAAPETMRLSTLLLALLFNQIGGVLPDIDQPTAPLWHNLPEGHVVGKVFGKLLGGHRFISHSIIGLALFGWLAFAGLHFFHPVMPHVDTTLVWYAFLIGYVSHLVMDTITKEGVPWLLPIPVKFGFPPVKDLRITTGKWVELLIVLPLLVAFDLWYAWHHYGQIVRLLHHVIA